MSQQLGGQVDPGGADGARDGEFGRAFLTVTEPCVLFDGLWEVGTRHQVWMSHGASATRFASGFRIVAVSAGATRPGERREGEGCVSQCRFRWSPGDQKKYKKNTNKNKQQIIRQPIKT